MSYESKLKEKNQINNLLDFKLREIARNGNYETYLKPHLGINKGILSEAAG